MDGNWVRVAKFVFSFPREGSGGEGRRGVCDFVWFMMIF